MNRNRLRLFIPPVEDETPATVSEQPSEIIPFQPRSRATVISGRFTAPVDRARIIRSNAACPECGHTDVEPLELEDAVISPRNRMPVPGTATIVGFHCHGCGCEWPVYELTTRRNG
jgi:hypothetical protein